jgi:hypothetical protein
MAYNTNAYAVPRAGIENAAGNEGRVITQCAAGELTDQDPSSSLQCTRSQNFHPNSAFFLKRSCASNPRTFSVGWCPSYNHPTGTGTNTDRKCTYEVAEKLCQTNYGGQLASIVNRAELDTLNQLLPAAAGNEQYLLGMHSDARGQWRYGDRTKCDAKCLAFLRAMSHDQLAGTSEHNLVFTPSQAYQGKGGLDDCCHNWNIDAFVCEAYAAPGSIAIGLGRTWDDANKFCMSHFGGTLLSIHNQHDYDTLARLAQGYTQPIMIGLHADGAGNWKWADKSPVKMDWLRAHSFDGLAGKKETVAVFYPPVCETGYKGNNPHKYKGKDVCAADKQDPLHFSHALHDWGTGQGPMAFACQASGHPRLMAIGHSNQDIPGQKPPNKPPPGGGH